MNKNYLILFIIILALVVSNCMNNKENMAVIKAKVFLKGDPISEIFDFKKKIANDNPLVEKDIAKTIVTSKKNIKKETPNLQEKLLKVQDDEYIIKGKKLSNIWEGKKMEVDKVMNIIETALKSCDVNDTILKKEDLRKFKNRKKFIKLIPLLKKKYRSNINYDNIKCFVSKYESNNYINISKNQNLLPTYLPPKNTMIIGTILYHFTPFGVIKYNTKINDKNNNIEIKDKVINATFESTVINDINIYNNTSHPIIVHKGNILKIKNNKFYNLINNEITDVTNIFLNQQIPEEESFNLRSRFDMQKSSDKYLQRILYVFKHSNNMFVVRPKAVFPNMGIAIKINNVLKKNNTQIQGVVPHFYYSKDKFNIRYLFLCNSNFYFYLNNDKISELLDFKKDYGYNFSKKIPYKLSCSEHKVILNQLVKSNKLSNKRKNKILNNLKCNN